eukprot:scaffold2626_cov92-Isochrysis_galbana.AAC.3
MRHPPRGFGIRVVGVVNGAAVNRWAGRASVILPGGEGLVRPLGNLAEHGGDPAQPEYHRHQRGQRDCPHTRRRLLGQQKREQKQHQHVEAERASVVRRPAERAGTPFRLGPCKRRLQRRGLRLRLGVRQPAVRPPQLVKRRRKRAGAERGRRRGRAGRDDGGRRPLVPPRAGEAHGPPRHLGRRGRGRARLSRAAAPHPRCRRPAAAALQTHLRRTIFL